MELVTLDWQPLPSTESADVTEKKVPLTTSTADTTNSLTSLVTGLACVV